MRAEINALYISVFETEVLRVNGLYKSSTGTCWYDKLETRKVQEQCIISMTASALGRYSSQAEDFKKMVVLTLERMCASLIS